MNLNKNYIAKSLHQYRLETEKELFSILNYWMQYAVDNRYKGFVGKMDSNNNIDPVAAKGSVLNARILWTFSSAFNQYQDKNYLHTATIAFDYITNHFIDKEYGGVFWTVDARGGMLDTKKQIYALAFAVYGLSEYYKASNNKAALDCALKLYNAIEEHSYDIVNKGYFEAFKKDWSTADDLRLSAKDANEKKTMNTHLHIVEAYVNLYKVYPSFLIKNKVIELFELFEVYFINKKTFHLKLFFDEKWNEKPDVISYGHDIEAAWLLQHCAEIIDNKKWINVYKKYAVKIANAAIEGLNDDGAMWYELEPQHQKIIKESHWWVQAEAMVGFMNAYQLTNDEKYLKHSINVWRFIKRYIIDSEKGEWFWGIKEDNSIMQSEDKVGLWKCPYHNARACLEIIKRIV